MLSIPREELWNLPQSASLSACLLLLITAGAVVGSVIYEKRVWCRYFCPIGAMNKIFAMVRHLCSAYLFALYQTNTNQ